MRLRRGAVRTNEGMPKSQRQHCRAVSINFLQQNSGLMDKRGSDGKPDTFFGHMLRKMAAFAGQGQHPGAVPALSGDGSKSIRIPVLKPSVAKGAAVSSAPVRSSAMMATSSLRCGISNLTNLCWQPMPIMNSQAYAHRQSSQSYSGDAQYPSMRYRMQFRDQRRLAGSAARG